MKIFFLSKEAAKSRGADVSDHVFFCDQSIILLTISPYAVVVIWEKNKNRSRDEARFFFIFIQVEHTVVYE